MGKGKVKLKPVLEVNKKLDFVMRATGLKCADCPGELARVGQVALSEGRVLVVLVCGKCGRVQLVVK